MKTFNKAQAIKWTVYVLLMFNWVFYAFEEYEMATHTLRQGGSLIEWAEAFATTIDELAWFGLLFMFELETYALENSAFETPWVSRLLHVVRLICYIFLAHTVLARMTTLVDVIDAEPASDVTHLCQVADQEISFGRNYVYDVINAENCGTFSQESSYVMLDPYVITDKSGWVFERRMATLDLLDTFAWLLVILSIELAVWLQNRDITGGRLMFASFAAKFFYAILFTHAGIWVYTGHWVWGWDQFLWIAGFWAIERNLSEWREEIKEESMHEHAPPAAEP